jgi:nucleoid DNA-binding protein
MNKDKISSQEIIDIVAVKASVSKRAAEEFLKVMIATIEEALLAGETVKIKNFGTFKLQWNEPRKSVNVQTGESIIIDGYHKVSFTPDSSLKEIVNEPFAHLEPVQLDGEAIQKVEIIEDDVPEPLRIFTEQASEIKSLISEIQALSPNAQPVDVTDDIDISDVIDTTDEDEIEDEELYQLLEQELEDEDDLVPFDLETEESAFEAEVKQNDDEEIVEKEEEVLLPTIENENAGMDIERNEVASPDISDEPIITSQHIEPDEIGPEKLNEKSDYDEESSSSPFLVNVKPLKKKRRRRTQRVLLVLLLLVVCSTVLYVLYPPATSIGNNIYAKLESTYTSIKENYSASNLFSGNKGNIASKSDQTATPETIVVLKDSFETDSDPVDSLQLLFDSPRVYPEFIATERVMTGSRLARMSQRYYGTSEFWVYIYEANMDRFDNPDQIPAGALIHIPKLDPRLIDASNPRCMDKAKELHDLYVNRPVKQ